MVKSFDEVYVLSMTEFTGLTFGITTINFATQDSKIQSFTNSDPYQIMGIPSIYILNDVPQGIIGFTIELSGS